jgi:hypothetical protein
MKNGRGMKDWYVVPPGVVAGEAALRSLFAKTFEAVLRRPPKAPRPGAKRRAPGGQRAKPRWARELHPRRFDSRPASRSRRRMAAKPRTAPRSSERFGRT